MPKDPKTAKKVTQVPPDYTEDTYVDPLNPNRKYYKKSAIQAAANPAAVVVRNKPVIRRAINGVSVKPRVKSTLDDMIDRVYIEPETTPPTTVPTQEQDSFMGDLVYDGAKHTIGRYVNRNTKVANRNVEGGAVNTQDENGDFYFTQPDVKGAPIDFSKGKYTFTNADKDEILGTERIVRKDIPTYFNNKKNTVKAFAGGGIAGSPYLGMAQSILGGFGQIMDNSDVVARADQYDGMVENLQQQANPYGFAMGGSIDDMDSDELEQLQEEADAAGMSLEEYLEQQQGEDVDGDNEEGEDTFNPDELEPADEDAVQEEDVDESAFRGYGYAMGGQVFGMGGIPINVEDKEILEDPNGNMAQVDGETHENGGENVNVQKGTKIYSDRLKIDGKTMQERKAKRERTIGTIKKKLSKDPSNQILKGTLERTNETHEAEDFKDMQIQKIANKIYGSAYPKSVNIKGEGDEHAMGGYAGGTDPNGVNPYMWPMYDELPSNNVSTPTRPMFYRDMTMPRRDITAPPATPIFTGNSPIIPTGSALGSETNTRTWQPMTKADVTVPPAAVGDSTDEESVSPFTTGDYIGLAGNIFNAVAPIINSRNAAKANKPNVNRWRGFGYRAIQANEQAQDKVGQIKTNADTDIDSNTNAAYSRNRDSASSVNTIRALDIATTMAKNKAKNATSDDLAKQQMQLLDQNGKLTMAQDQAEMGGQERMDVADKQDLDNYYSNMANDLMNFGTNIQGIGKSLNKSKSNQMNRKLIAALSKHGLTFDKNGNLVSLKK